MTDQAFSDRVAEFLATKTFLVNAFVSGEVAMCPRCRGPVGAGFELCFQCNEHGKVSGALLADVCGFVAYAVDDGQLARDMYGYKDLHYRAVDDARAIVSSLLYGALAHHGACLEALTGAAPTVVCHVPSTQGRTGVHPMELVITRVRPMVPGCPVPRPLLRAGPRAGGRDLDVEKFGVAGRVDGQHVLVIDDTWAGGGHVQSAAWTLRLAGAATVSTLCVARWLATSFTPGRELIGHVRGLEYQRPFSADWCPWTDSGRCPVASGGT